MSHVSVDFETFFSKRLKYSVRTLIAEEYCRHELFECYLISVSNGERAWAGNLADFNWDSINGKVWVSHNRYFDNSVFNELKRRNIVPAHIAPSVWHCTSNLATYICNRRALQDAIEYLYKVKVDKGYRVVANDKHWPQDFNEQERKQVIDAGASDAHWCWKLWNDYSPQWPEWEQKLSNITIDQGMRGVQIDEDLLNQYILQSHEMRSNCEKVIPWIAGSDDEEDYEWDEFEKEGKRKPTSTKCIAEQCRRVNIPCAPVKSKDAEGYEEWEREYAPAHPWIRAVGDWRSVNKLYASFLVMKRRIRPDGTMPFALKYFGAHTGRWAGDAKINFQNMRKAPVFCKLDGFVESDDILTSKAIDYFDDNGKYPDWVKYAIDFRALIKPRPGYKMIACDLSQIEPRVLAWLGKNWALLEKIKSGMSVYEAFARTQMNYQGPPFSKAFKRTDEYKLIKIQVLQLGYQAGWEKFIVTALKESGLDLTKDDPEFTETEDINGQVKKTSGYGQFAQKVVKTFREQNPKITGLWEALDAGFRMSLGQRFTMRLPSGRVMRYDDVKCQTKITAHKETGKPVKKTEFTAEVGGKRKPFYGGKLVENITQAVARDVFATQIVRLAEKGHLNLFSCHDEAVLECKPEVTAAEIEAEMSYCPEWLEPAPIAAEGKELEHYTK